MRENVRIPERVLDWRDRQGEGSIMSKRTFQSIKKKARRAGYEDPAAVAGKGYWITVLTKYLDRHPDDQSARRALRAMTRYSRVYSNPRGMSLREAAEAVVNSYFKGKPLKEEYGYWIEAWTDGLITRREMIKKIKALLVDRPKAVPPHLRNPKDYDFDSIVDHVIRDEYGGCHPGKDDPCVLHAKCEDGIVYVFVVGKWRGVARCSKKSVVPSRKVIREAIKTVRTNTGETFAGKEVILKFPQYS